MVILLVLERLMGGSWDSITLLLSMSSYYNSNKRKQYQKILDSSALQKWSFDKMALYSSQMTASVNTALHPRIGC